MAIVWRGMGIAVPILIFLSYGALAHFFDDTRLGNLRYTGWALAMSATLALLPAMASFGDDPEAEAPVPWHAHSFFFVPIVFWPLILGAGSIWALTRDSPPARRAGPPDDSSPSAS